MTEGSGDKRVVDIDEARAENLVVKRTHDPEDRRVPWLIVGIGMVMLLVLFVANIITVYQNVGSERRQDKLSDCFRRVIITINARTEYNEQLRKVEAALADAPSNLVTELARIPPGDVEARESARGVYLRKVEDLKAQRASILDKQSRFQYPSLDECEKA